MKNFKKYILALGLVGLGACGDKFLDTEPLTTVTESNFYKTPEDAFTALVGCYDGLQISSNSAVALPMASELLSDNVFGGTGNSDDFKFQMVDEFDKLRAPAEQNLYQENWTNYYEAVYRCNVLISKLDGVAWGTKADLRNIYESEARFIRAYLYFDMVRLWENIPLVTVPTTENLTQADPADVYALIAEDLKFASENLENITYAAQPAATRGRVTKWAAESLLARVFLYYTGRFEQADLAGVITKAQALAAVEDVIASSGHGLIDDFNELWPAASMDSCVGEDNMETIFSIKFTYTSDYNGNTDGNGYMPMFGMRSLNSYPYGKGWGGGTVNPKLWDLYEDEDTRKVATIISIDDEDIPFDDDKKKDQREYTVYCNKKYSPLSAKNGQDTTAVLGATNFFLGQFQDYVAIRYADVLLMAAELGSPDAQSYFDEVRTRAYKENFAPVTVTQENIMHERHLEFALEGIRYWDLMRQGIDVTAAAIAETTTVLNGNAPASKTILEAKILGTNGIAQIPVTQITLSGNVLKQNAGWE